MPSDTVYVGRPTIWGNPFSLADGYTREEAVAKYEEWLRGELNDRPHMLDPLIGKDLACWCSLSEACHADVILKILAERVRTGGR
jgi:hypothetical protein